MAGGVHAAAAPCWTCGARAERIREGLETDWYRCEACSKTFGIDFEDFGPPDAPLWPGAAGEQSGRVDPKDWVIQKLIELAVMARVQITPRTELAEISGSLPTIHELVRRLHAAFDVKVDWKALPQVTTVDDLAALVVRSMGS